MVETRGRRVLVRDDAGERVCVLSGCRAVVGDHVLWVEVRGTGGKLVSVEPRSAALKRVDARGREQVLAAHLGGLLIVAPAQQPAFSAGLVDRYLVAAGSAGIAAAVCLNKIDLGVPDEVEAALALRVAAGVETVRASAVAAGGVAELEAFLAQRSAGGPWALVGHSGVGKTSLVAALLPGDEVGAVSELSEYWGTGQHTTTSSRLFALPGGGEVVDSPGIRTFAPGSVAAIDVRRFFRGVGGLDCRYRDCLHREGEDGCEADAGVPAPLLVSYRRIVEELLSVEARQRSGKRG